MAFPEGMNPQVLLVDASGRLQEYLAEELTSAGFDIRSVASATECLEYVNQHGTDGVVSHHDLPAIDGDMLLRSIRISNPRLPVVLFSPAPDLVEEKVSSNVSSAVADNADAEAVVSELEGLLNQEMENMQRYKHLIEMSPAPINIFDREGRSIWCNDAVAEIFGLDSREELLGRSILELIHPDDREQARAEISSVIDQKESTGPTRMKLRRDDGGVRYVRVSTAVGHFLGEDIGQAIAIDETERIERERQLKVLDNWLRHNIRNKMTIITGLAENIQTGEVADVDASARSIQEHAAKLVQQADHERQIIRLLDTMHEQTHVSVDIDDLVDRVVVNAREDYPEAAISVATMEPFDADAIAELDVAIQELVENAITHSDTDQPEITVSVEDTAADYGIIRIADNGPGIPEIEQNYLQLDKEINQMQHGSGLGLIFVYWVIRLSEGNITVANNDPRGSVVTVTLPKG
jgi:PAS domain S-box-containing protein